MGFGKRLAFGLQFSEQPDHGPRFRGRGQHGPKGLLHTGLAAGGHLGMQLIFRDTGYDNGPGMRRILTRAAAIGKVDQH